MGAKPAGVVVVSLASELEHHIFAGAEDPLPLAMMSCCSLPVMVAEESE